MLLGALDHENPFNKDYMIGKEKRDGIGLGMSKTKLLKFLFGHMKIIGLVCSANDVASLNKSIAVECTCDDKI